MRTTHSSMSVVPCLKLMSSLDLQLSALRSRAPLISPMMPSLISRLRRWRHLQMMSITSSERHLSNYLVYCIQLNILNLVEFFVYSNYKVSRLIVMCILFHFIFNAYHQWFPLNILHLQIQDIARNTCWSVTNRISN